MYTTWRKSSYSDHNGSCVEVAFRDLSVGVRDSKNLASPHLTVPAIDWSRFVVAVKNYNLG